MDLKLFFSPVDEAITSEIIDQNSFLKSIHVNTGEMPNYQQVDIALIGIKENRGIGIEKNANVDEAIDEVRKKLYGLKKGFGAYNIIDLGDLNNGINLEETQLRLKEVCQFLIENNTLPIIIGGSHDMDYGQYMSYEGMEKLISVLNVDAILDLETDEKRPANHCHVHQILMHEPNYLFNFIQLGYQNYLNDNNVINVLEKLYFETYRLGKIREDFKEIEPVIRGADMMSFDITAIKSVDAPGNASPQAFGFTAEESCQIAWYAGLNEKMSSVGFYEYSPMHDDQSKKTAFVLATMIWHFIEGFYHRKDESSFKKNDYIKYVVTLEAGDEEIVFFKSLQSEKWWMEVPYAVEAIKSVFSDVVNLTKKSLVPCSYKDYQLAMDGELPERWVTAQSKLS